MLNVGTYVIRGNYGVCRIEDVVRLDENKDRMYYLLVPAEGGNSKFYLPVDQARVKVRCVLSREEAWDLIHRLEGIKELPVSNDKLREDQYAEAVGSGSPETLVSLAKYLHGRKRERAKLGKDMISVDRRYLQLTKHLLNSELSFVTGEHPDIIEDMLLKAMQA